MVLWYLTWISCGFLWPFPSKSSSHGFPVTRTWRCALQGFGSGVSPWWKTCTACDGPQMMWPVPLRIIWTIFFGKNMGTSVLPPNTGWWFGTFGLFFHMLGMSSSQLTNSFFSEWFKPPTRISWGISCTFSFEPCRGSNAEEPKCSRLQGRPTPGGPLWP